MTGTMSRLAAALADRYRFERAATPVAARRTIAPRFGSPRHLAARLLPGQSRISPAEVVKRRLAP
jgi:hypothetical protein